MPLFRPTRSLTLIALSLNIGLQAAEATLEERVKALEATREEAQHAVRTSEDQAIAESAGESGTTADSKSGFTIASDDGSFSLKIGGYIQAEGRFYLNDDDVPLTNTVVLRRARIVAEVRVGLFDYRVAPEFGSGTTVLQDAFIAAPVRPWLRLQIGRGKVPVGLEFLQSDTVSAFIERGFPSQLVPNRDNGVQVTGEIAGGLLSYAVGMFNGSADGASRDSDNTDDKDGVARLTSRPFVGGHTALSGLLVGVGASYGSDEGIGSATAVTSSGLSTYRSTGLATIFAYDTTTNIATTVIADGSRWRVAPQLYYAVGPFSAMAEYTRSSVDLSEAGNAGTIVNNAWHLNATWTLTGENAAFKGVAPASSLNFDGSGWGAVELVARVHRLDIDHDAFDDGFANPATSVEEATGYGVGMKWYASRNLQLKLNFEHTVFKGGAASGADRESENLISAQVQLIY